MTSSNEEGRQAAYFAAQLAHLADRAAKSGVVLFSNFLTVSQQETAISAAKRAGAACRLYGGGTDSYRKMAAFSKDEADLTDAAFPLAILQVSPDCDARFLTHALTHRDYLGALMGLSVKREMIGDIVIGEDAAYVFVHEKMVSYLMTEWSSVGRAPITVLPIEKCPLSSAVKTIELSVTVSSMRLDCVTAQLIKGGRNAAVEWIRMKNVRIGDQTVVKPDALLTSGQELSIRGHGKYRIGQTSPTRKGRIALVIYQYQ
jgi:RNA-binding protein YlmH